MISQIIDVKEIQKVKPYQNLPPDGELFQTLRDEDCKMVKGTLKQSKRAFDPKILSFYAAKTTESIKYTKSKLALRVRQLNTVRSGISTTLVRKK